MLCLALCQDGDPWHCRRDEARVGRAPRVADPGDAAWRSSASSSTASRPTGSLRSPNASMVRLPRQIPPPCQCQCLFRRGMLSAWWSDMRFHYQNAVVNVSWQCGVTGNVSVFVFPPHWFVVQMSFTSFW